MWTALAVLAPLFFIGVYLPGYALGIGLCWLQGHFEHVGGTTSHYGRLYNLYLDPKESHSYLVRKLACLEALQSGFRDHLMTFREHPPKQIVGINV